MKYEDLPSYLEVYKNIVKEMEPEKIIIFGKLESQDALDQICFS